MKWLDDRMALIHQTNVKTTTKCSRYFFVYQTHLPRYLQLTFEKSTEKCVPAILYAMYCCDFPVLSFFRFNMWKNESIEQMDALCEQVGMQCTIASKSWSSIKIICQVLIGDDWISHCTESKLMSYPWCVCVWNPPTFIGALFFSRLTTK